MIDSGLPLVQCLDILSKQTEDSGFRTVITEVMHDVEAGTTLAEAMGKHHNAFDSLYVNMVDAGEAGGILDKILQRSSYDINHGNKPGEGSAAAKLNEFSTGE